jgi:hypothetical protein
LLRVLRPLLEIPTKGFLILTIGKENGIAVLILIKSHIINELMFAKGCGCVKK